MRISAVIDAARQPDGSLRCEVPACWLQGRTAYGGFTAALAYGAARSLEQHVPPLRSAQIVFAGPASGLLHARAVMLRRGKSSAFVEVRVTAGGELALSATFLFMAERESPVQLLAPRAPAAPAPEEAEPAMRGRGPAYRSQLEYRHAMSIGDRGKPELMRWVRLRERDAIDPVTELLLIGDALPPGILPVLAVPPMASSANWTVHLHGSDIVAHDGWWLVQTRAESAVGGISSQLMAVWNRAGVAVMSGSQTISFFV